MGQHEHDRADASRVVSLPALPDKRALGMPDTAFSAYCKVCWFPVYLFWVDEPHDGACINDCTLAANCAEAANRTAPLRWRAVDPATEVTTLSDEPRTLEVTNAAQDAVVGVQQPAKGPLKDLGEP